MTLVRVNQTDSGDEFSILDLQTINRVECRDFDQEQDERRATVTFPEDGRVVLAGADADRVVIALEDFPGYPRWSSRRYRLVCLEKKALEPQTRVRHAAGTTVLA